MMGNNIAQERSDREYKPRNIWALPFGMLLLFLVTCLFYVRADLAAHKNNRVEFRDMSALDQYNCLNYTSEYVGYLRQRVGYLKLKVEEAEGKYVNYGDKSSWPVHIRSLYDQKVQPLRHNLKNAVEEYNVMATEYNLKAGIFKWSAFESNIQKPPRSFEEIDLKDVGL